MVPPFLAYYGAITNNATLIQAAYDQIRLYRNYLRSDSGLWRHIALGQGADPGYWATGNGWAAAGILRVYATIMNGGFGSQFSSQSTDLASWAAEIVEASFPLIKVRYSYTMHSNPY